MSAYEDALRGLEMLEILISELQVEVKDVRGLKRLTFRLDKNEIDLFLTALPPSIVVDGRVVELADLYRGRYVNHEELAQGILDAAREVADRE